MIKVRVFGLFRLDTGIKEMDVQACSVRELYPLLLAEARRLHPDTKITAKDIDGCIISVNDKPGKKSSKLSDGDVVQLMSPVCGG